MGSLEVMTGVDAEDEWDDDNPDLMLPLQHTWLARILRRLGAHFEDFYWPATWTLWARDNMRERYLAEHHGWDLWLCIMPTSWTVGPEFESDLESSERWKDVSLHVGPFILVLHRWRLRSQRAQHRP